MFVREPRIVFSDGFDHFPHVCFWQYPTVNGMKEGTKEAACLYFLSFCFTGEALIICPQCPPLTLGEQ